MSTKGEKWIEEKRAHEFWISEKRSYPENLYSRLTRSYVGWWCYFRLRSIWSKAGLLIDPLSCGGFQSHVSCFLYNAVVVGIWWRMKHRVWRAFHPKEWQNECYLMDAVMQATMEGCGEILSEKGEKHAHSK